MSNVTKPILLDETGKEILGALRNLVDARGNPVVQETGNSETAVMSQKATTTAIDDRAKPIETDIHQIHMALGANCEAVESNVTRQETKTVPSRSIGQYCMLSKIKPTYWWGNITGYPIIIKSNSKIANATPLYEGEPDYDTSVYEVSINPNGTSLKINSLQSGVKPSGTIGIYCDPVALGSARPVYLAVEYVSGSFTGTCNISTGFGAQNKVSVKAHQDGLKYNTIYVSTKRYDFEYFEIEVDETTEFNDYVINVYFGYDGLSLETKFPDVVNSESGTRIPADNFNEIAESNGTRLKMAYWDKDNPSGDILFNYIDVETQELVINVRYENGSLIKNEEKRVSVSDVFLSQGFDGIFKAPAGSTLTIRPIRNVYDDFKGYYNESTFKYIVNAWEA